MTPETFRDQLNTTPNLTHHEWAVGHALASFMDSSGRCWPAVETLARVAHLGESTVREAINGSKRTGFTGLVSKGLITSEPRPRPPGAAHNLTTVYTALQTTRRTPAHDHPTDSGPEGVVRVMTVGRRTPVGGDPRPVEQRFPKHGEPGIGGPENTSGLSPGADGAMVAGAEGPPQETVAEQRARYAGVAWKALEEDTA